MDSIPPSPVRHEVQKCDTKSARSAETARKRGHVPPGFYTRAMLMEKTGLTEREVYLLESRGKIVPVARTKRQRGRRGWALYDDSTIEKLKRTSLATSDRFPSLSRKQRYTAYDGVKVFELLEKGVSGPAIVIETGLHPSFVETIREDYALLTRAVMVPRAVMTRINQLEGKIDGVFPIENAEDLLRLVERLAEGRVCKECNKHARKLCGGCARRIFTPAEPIPPPKAPPMDPGELTEVLMDFVRQHPGTTSVEVQQNFGVSGAVRLSKLAANLGRLRRERGDEPGAVYRYYLPGVPSDEAVGR